jgi:hypothetical protein
MMNNGKNKLSALAVAVSVGLTATLSFWPTAVIAYELKAAFSAECPTTDFPMPEGRVESPTLAVAIAASLASSLVDTGVAALKKTVNPGNATLEAQYLEQGMYMYMTPTSGAPAAAATSSGAASATKGAVKPSTKMGCLVVAAGTFSQSDDGAKGWKLPFSSDRDGEPREEGPTSANWRVANALNLRGPATLALYMEAARVFSGDRTAVTWKPVRLYVGEYLNDSFWAGKSRGTSVEMRLYKPGKKEAFLSQEFPFAAIQKPVSRNSKDLGTANAGTWSALPAAPALPANLNPSTEGRAFDPFTLEVRIVESPKPYSLAVAFADAVEKNKDSLKKEVTNVIDPTAKVSAELTGHGATLDAVSNFLTTLKSAVSECAADKVKDDAGRLSCSIARDKATVAKQKAGLSCASNSVPTCDSLPKVPEMPS